MGAGKQVHRWELSGPDGAKAEIHYTPRFITTDMLALREAAMAGVGVVQLPILMVRDQLASGELVRVLEAWEPRREVIHAVFPSRRGLLPSVRTLVDFLIDEYARMVEE
jgi:DNA-binding transcriptional LysR family regulator